MAMNQLGSGQGFRLSTQLQGTHHRSASESGGRGDRAELPSDPPGRTETVVNGVIIRGRDQFLAFQQEHAAEQYEKALVRQVAKEVKRYRKALAEHAKAQQAYLTAFIQANPNATIDQLAVGAQHIEHAFNRQREGIKKHFAPYVNFLRRVQGEESPGNQPHK